MYVTIAEVKKFVKSEKLETMTDTDIEKTIKYATDMVDNYCKTKFVSTQKILKVDGGSSKIYFPCLPVISVDTVIEDKIPLDEDIDFFIYDSYILREEGFNKGRKNVEITYNYGYETVTGVVSKVCLELIQAFLADDGYESEKYKDYSYTLKKNKDILVQLRPFKQKRKHRIGVI